MAETKTLKVESDSRGVVRLTLARPEKHNALDAELIDALRHAAERLGRDPAVRVVVLAAEGPSFCAGGDLGWMRAQMEADAAARAREARRLAEMLGALDAMPRPLIGRVHGNAFGGGVGLMAVCDIAVVAQDAVLALSETRLGLIPATIAPYVVGRMGAGPARRVFLSGRRFSGREAAAFGLAARAEAIEDLDEAVEAEVSPFLDCAPGAVAEAKALVRRLGPRIDEAVIAETIGALVKRWESDEAREGIAAFFERRKPSWAV